MSEHKTRLVSPLPLTYILYLTHPLFLNLMAKSKSTISPFSWTSNKHELTWKLVAEMGKHENFRVLFGKTDKDEVSTTTG